jgi:Holliday junction DNA helicase RuvA
VLSGLEPDNLVDAIRRRDLRRLSTIPGVGKKTAERVVLELSDKMPEVMALVGGAAPEGQSPSPDSALRDDLLSALVNLGYQRGQADKTVAQVLKEEPDLSFEAALKKTLRRLSG